MCVEKEELLVRRCWSTLCPTRRKLLSLAAVRPTSRHRSPFPSHAPTRQQQEGVMTNIREEKNHSLLYSILWLVVGSFTKWIENPSGRSYYIDSSSSSSYVQSEKDISSFISSLSIPFHRLDSLPISFIDVRRRLD